MYDVVRHMFNNIHSYSYKEEENTKISKKITPSMPLNDSTSPIKEGNDKDTFSSFQEEEKHEKGNPINSVFIVLYNYKYYD